MQDKTNACFLFADEESGKQIGEIIVPLASPDFHQLHDSGYKYLQVATEPPLMVRPELFNAVQEGVFAMLDAAHTDPVVSYTKWLKSLNDADLEDEYFERFNDKDSDENDRKFAAADDVRNARLTAGRYLEDVY